MGHPVHKQLYCTYLSFPGQECPDRPDEGGAGDVQAPHPHHEEAAHRGLLQRLETEQRPHPHRGAADAGGHRAGVERHWARSRVRQVLPDVSCVKRSRVCCVKSYVSKRTNQWVRLRESGYVSLSAKCTNPQNSYPPVGTFRNVTVYTTDPCRLFRIS